MKSFIIIFALLITSLYSDAKTYIGINYGEFNEKFTSLDAESSSEFYNIKVGYGLREAYAIEVSFDTLNNESSFFSNNDSKKYAMNIELVKSFDYDIYILPYLKTGFGAGQLKIERELQSKLNYGTFNLGAGVFIPINQYLDFELGYNYKHLSYQAIDTIADNISYKSKVGSFYFGFNARY